MSSKVVRSLLQGVLDSFYDEGNYNWEAVCAFYDSCAETLWEGLREVAERCGQTPLEYLAARYSNEVYSDERLKDVILTVVLTELAKV